MRIKFSVWRHRQPRATTATLFADVRHMRPRQNRCVRRTLRPNPQCFRSHIRDRPDVGFDQSIALNQPADRLRQLLSTKRNTHAIHGRRLVETLEVSVQAKDGRFAIHGVTANALEHTRSVMQSVSRERHCAFRPWHEVAVHPSPLNIFE